MSENVTLLPQKRRAKGLQIVRESGAGRCDHQGVAYIVDEKLATVECERCKEKLNPTWCMLQLARAESRWMATRQEYIEICKLLPDMKRTKCRHCGKFTDLRFNVTTAISHRIRFGPWDPRP